MSSLFSFFPEIVKKVQISQHIRRRCPQELLLMKGKHVTSSTNQSILFFTVHRCASQYVKSIFKKVTQGSAVTLMDISSYIWKGGKQYAASQDIYKKYGYIYGPFYGLDSEELPIPIPDLETYKILLILRDPRDVLVSYYYHHAFETYLNPAQENLIKKRSKKTLSKTIDEWVLEMLPLFKERYITYLETFRKNPDVLLLKYEDMVTDFNKWLYSLIEFTNLKPEPEIMESIKESANFSVKKENVASHKRQVTPGDHRRKLKETTIITLNSELSEILKELNY